MMEQIWRIEEKALIWDVKPNQIHEDKIEMAGLYCASHFNYGMHEDGSLLLSQDFYFPMLRKVPNDTHGTFCFSLKEDRPVLMKNGEAVADVDTGCQWYTAENMNNEEIAPNLYD